MTTLDGGRWRLSHDAVAAEEVIAVDGWRTVVRGPYPEPIQDLQEILAHKLVESDGRRVVELDQAFLDYCLTRNLSDVERFLYDVAEHFGLVVPPDGLDRLRFIVEHERNNLLIYWDAVETLHALKSSGYKLALVINSWVFPIDRLKTQTALGQIFDHWVCSHEFDHPKPQADMFEAVCRHFRVSPNRVVMVGDNPRLDVEGALRYGMHAVYLHREAHPHLVLPEESRVRTVTTLSDLLIRDWGR